MIELRLLGTLGLTSEDGREVRSLLSQPKRLALLTYLAIARPLGFHRRDTLLGLFWADSDEVHARNALRQALHYLRRSLGPEIITSRGEDELRVDTSRVTCDVHEFLAALDTEDRESGLALYAGDLLPGFYIDGAAGFERWLEEERRHLRLQAAGAAREEAEAAEARGDLERAVHWARRWAGILPQDEEALRGLLRLLDESGNAVAAVAEYDGFAARIEQETGSQPSPQTRALAATILQRGGVTARPADSTRPPKRSWRPATQVGVMGVLAGVGAVALLTAMLGPLRRNEPTATVVPSPRQVTFVGNVMEASVSPRDAFLAFTTRDDERSRLVVLDLETNSSIEIASRRDFIGYPDWSPDGRLILVGSGDGSDYRHLAYPRLGGDPRVIPTAGSSRWSADGRHLYYWGQTSKEIVMLALDAQSEERIRTADTTTFIYDVAPHPDGGALALLHKPLVGGGSSIWQLTIDTSGDLEAARRDSTGRLLASDTQRLVTSDSDIYAIKWSPTGEFLFYLTETAGTFDLWRIRGDEPAGAGSPELLVRGLELAAPARPWESLLSVSEDGSSLFLVRGQRFSNLWSMRATDEIWEIEQLTSGTMTNEGASVSPDGERIAYASTVGDRTDLFVMSSRGGPPRQLTRLDSISGYPVWSPDGSSIAFGLRRDGHNQVATVEVEGESRVRVFESTRLSGSGTIAWAPGAEILYQRPGFRNFHFLDPVTGDERPLFADSEAEGLYLSAHYSPDGDELLLERNLRERDRAGLWVMPLDGGPPRRLDSEPYVAAIGWSADGTFAYALSPNRRDVIAVPVGGGPPTLLESLPFEASRPASTYGGGFFVLTSAQGVGDVWRIDGVDVGR